jgi:hypothetical protein
MLFAIGKVGERTTTMETVESRILRTSFVKHFLRGCSNKHQSYFENHFAQENTHLHQSYWPYTALGRTWWCQSVTTVRTRRRWSTSIDTGLQAVEELLGVASLVPIIIDRAMLPKIQMRVHHGLPLSAYCRAQSWNR